VARLRITNQDSSIVISLHYLQLAPRLICPDVDWSWLLTITKRIAAAASRRAQKYGLVAIEQLYPLDIALIDNAIADANAFSFQLYCSCCGGPTRPKLR